MFNNMKNKIREKTGSELPKLTTSAMMVGKTRSNQHSRQNSQGSINSITSDLGNRDDNETRITNSNSNSVKTISTPNSQMSEEESSVKTVDWQSKIAEKEREWREKEKAYVADLLKQTKELQEALSLTEEHRKKLMCCQEEKEQLELYQKQEVSKIKELLLAKEEENNANVAALKNALTVVDSLKQEVNRLTPLEQQINNYQDDLEFLRHTSEKERWNLTSQLAQKEEKIRHLDERITVLMHRTEADCQALGQQLSTDERVRSLVAERALLERRLEEAHIHLSEIKTSWSNKIANLETQVGRLGRQAGEEGVERRNAEKKISTLERKLEQCENDKDNLKKKLEKLTRERDSIALELKQMSADASSRNSTGEADQLQDLSTKIEVLSKENEALRLSNEESRRILDETLYKEIAKNNELNVEIVKLKEYTQTLAIALEEEKKVKDETLLRNAEISQMVQLADQDLKQQQGHNKELFKKISTLEEQLQQSQQNLEKVQSEKTITKDEKLEDRMKELENEINDKNKSIRILQQNLSDVKKTFQAELKNNLQSSKTNIESSAPLEDDINNKYMKHVLIKFLTSSEYEAQQLTKAVATLLKLSSEEERLIKETLEWRSSWFGSKPRVKLHNYPS